MCSSDLTLLVTLAWLAGCASNPATGESQVVLMSEEKEIELGKQLIPRFLPEGEDERAGRWWWENPDTRECGIHTGYEAEGSGI